MPADERLVASRNEALLADTNSLDEAGVAQLAKRLSGIWRGARVSFGLMQRTKCGEYSQDTHGAVEIGFGAEHSQQRPRRPEPRHGTMTRRCSCRCHRQLVYEAVFDAATSLASPCRRNAVVGVARAMTALRSAQFDAEHRLPTA